MAGDRVYRVLAVVFGQRLTGSANLLVAPLFGVYLAAYARALWTRRRAALALGVVYAVYVTLNGWLFRIRSPDLDAVNSLYGVTYVLIALVVSWEAVAILASRARAERSSVSVP